MTPSDSPGLPRLPRLLLAGALALLLPVAAGAQDICQTSLQNASAILRNRGTGTDETVAYHGNPRYIVVGDRLATTFVANPWGGKVTAGVSTFEKDQTVLRLTRRVGAIIWVPGYFTQLSGVEV